MLKNVAYATTQPKVILGLQFIKEFTLVKNPLNVICVVTQVLITLVSQDMKEFIQVKNHMNVAYVVTQAVTILVLPDIKEFTLVKTISVARIRSIKTRVVTLKMIVFSVLVCCQ